MKILIGEMVVHVLLQTESRKSNIASLLGIDFGDHINKDTTLTHLPMNVSIQSS